MNREASTDTSSMTAFGRGETPAPDGNGKYVVEVRSVNHRFLDISVKTPRRIAPIEEVIRAGISKRFTRGSFEAVVTFPTLNGKQTTVSVDRKMAEQITAQAREIQSALGLSGNIDINTILQVKDVIQFIETESDYESILPPITSALDAALENLAAMRRTEGAATAADIIQRLKLIDRVAAEIRDSLPKINAEVRARIREKMNGLLQPGAVDETRLAQEAAFYADRSDVTEEITRLESHIAQFRELMAQPGPKGRKMDFIVQEMNREANTTGSKANHQTISANAILIKSELEKIREQVQNVE